MIGKRQGAVADDLAGFMTFPGGDQHVACPTLPDCRMNGLGPISAFARTLRTLPNLGADRGGLFGARVVVGHDHGVALLDRDPAHDRPLAPVPVAAAAEHAYEPSLSEGTKRVEHMGQRVGL